MIHISKITEFCAEDRNRLFESIAGVFDSIFVFQGIFCWMLFVHFTNVPHSCHHGHNSTNTQSERDGERERERESGRFNMETPVFSFSLPTSCAGTADWEAIVWQDLRWLQAGI